MEKRSQEFPGVVLPVKAEELRKFLDVECGNRCLDDDEDRAAVCQALLEKFNIYQESGR